MLITKIKETNESYIYLITFNDDILRICSFSKQNYCLKSYTKFNVEGEAILRAVCTYHHNHKLESVVLENEIIKRVLKLKADETILEDYLDNETIHIAVENGIVFDTRRPLDKKSRYLKGYLKTNQKYIQHISLAELFVAYPSNEELEEIIQINELSREICNLPNPQNVIRKVKTYSLKI